MIAEAKNLEVKEIKLTDRPKYTKKDLVADHPTWCPGCGDFSILSIYFKMMEKLQIPHEKITSIAGIGCSSRFPYFVNAYGVHFLHGRAAAFATGVSLMRPDLHVFVFGGDGDAFSIGGNHLTHAARKNIKMTYVIMDNFVYGLTKKQTSPTSPLGFKSKTDPTGAVDHPINPMKQLIAAGATFIARSHSHLPNHVMEMMEKAMQHDGFSVIECLSECTEFYPGRSTPLTRAKAACSISCRPNMMRPTKSPPTSWRWRISRVILACSTMPCGLPRTRSKPS